MTLCELTDLDTTMCAHCRGLTLDNPTDVEIDYTFTARYDGRCAKCANTFHVGDRIGCTTEGHYLCGRCIT